MCKSIQNSQSIDIIEIDAASNRGIDEIRSLRDSVKYAPTRGKYKVYIIDEVHMLTKESFNAFLKTLEEPPEHIIFIFATTDVHKLPLTIISRCQRYDFRRIQLDKIKETLRMIADEEKIKIDDKTLTIIAKKADGALRDAESYFDQVVAFSKGKIDAELVTQMLNLIDEEISFKISDAVIEKDFKVVFQTSEKIYENGWDFGDFVDGLIEHFRNILSVTVTDSTSSI
jgi:DNA polymerase III subunit gamma/tau